MEYLRSYIDKSHERDQARDSMLETLACLRSRRQKIDERKKQMTPEWFEKEKGKLDVQLKKLDEKIEAIIHALQSNILNLQPCAS